MIPKIISQIWIGGPMPAHLAAYVAGVKAMNPKWIHLLIDEKELDSLGLSLAAILARHGTMSFACASSLIRLHLLDRIGGIYLDVDCECLQPLDELTIHSAFAAEQDGGRLCNAAVGAEPHHPWVQWQLAHMDDFDIRDGAAWIYLMTAAPRGGVKIIPQHILYPFLWDEPLEKRRPHPDSIVVHHWEKSWGPQP